MLFYVERRRMLEQRPVTSHKARHRKLFTMACMVALASHMAAAQQPGPMPQIQAILPQQQSSATVSGRVVCSDTQHAARFAQVTLIPVEAASENAGRGQGFGRGGAGRTDLDGNFTVTNVQPGDYYATASATGYISEAALLMAAGTDAATALSHLPVVHVMANAPSTVNISLERGGVVAGRVQWDDGTAAAGVQVNLQSVTANNSGGFGGGRGGFVAGFIGGNNQFSMTDDRGQFRISGIAPGDYLLRSTVQTPVTGGNFTRMSAVVMYAPGKVRRADAQVISVRAGEERTDLAMTIDLSTLHRVSGHVGATSGTVASGTVRLVDSQDTTLSRTATISPDGSYSLTYVPAGTYVLSVPFASSSTNQPGRGPDFNGNSGSGGGRNRTPASTFQPFQETLTVTDTDLSDVNVNLTPATQQSSQ